MFIRLVFSFCRSCRTVDELSCCIDQLEAEIDSNMCNRHAICNGEADNGSNSSHRGGDSIVGCMKCHKDNSYEQVTTCHNILTPIHFKSHDVLISHNVTHYMSLPYMD